MFQNGQRVCFRNGGDPARIQKVQIAYGKDRQRVPRVIPTNDLNATQVQVVTGADAARYPFIDPIGIVGAPAAWYRADTGVTVTGQGASTVADQSGNGRDLLQGTDANRPPYLSYSGEKYCWSLGVASNTVTAPTETLTGSQTFTYDIALDDYTPSANVTLFSKLSGNNGIELLLLTTGVLRLRIGDGAAVTNVDSTVAVGTTDGTRHTFVAAWSDGVGASFTVDGSALGTAVAAVKTLTNAATTATIGPWSGKIYRARIGTNYDFNPDLDGSDQAATITSSATGEIWTINKSGGLPAQIVARPSLLFDGTADYLKTNAFTLNQPETVYIVFKQVSYTVNDVICDGNTSGTLRILQGANSGELYMRISSTIQGGSLALGTYGVASHVSNGANSVLGINLVSPATGDIGSANAGGFTLGSNATPGAYANIQVLEVLVAAAAHSSEQRARIVQYLAGRHGIAL